MYNSTDSRIIPSRFKSTCKETKLKILCGDLMLYNPLTKNVYHSSSNEYQLFLLDNGY